MVTASYGRYGQRAARIGPDCICRIRLPATVSVPFFKRRHGSYGSKPTRIRSEWPGQGLAKRIWSGSKPVCRNYLARFLAGHNRPATSFPLSVLPLSPRIKLCKTSPGSDLVLADSVRFWQKRIRSGSKPMCKDHPARFWSMLPSRSGPDASRIRHVSWEESSVHWAPKQRNKAAQSKADKCPTSHFPPCNC